MQAFAPAGFVGSKACSACHSAEFNAWKTSDHAKAMMVVTPATVSGDFDDVSVEHLGSKARFYRDGDRFIVETDDRDGKPQSFTVSHTFGVYPLQQYLVTFPDGRLQALPFAWDTRPKAEGGQRWFHLYQNQPMPASDPLHWTRGQQNWNFMCAECHSTALKKGYDAPTDSFHTTFSEISVGCESCHGAGAAHVSWASSGADTAVANHGFASVATVRPPADWTPDPKTGSPAHGVTRPVGDVVETCARCHARRGTLSENWQPGRALADTHMESLLASGLFEDDGQMKDEVFNDQSFKQSLMFARGVTCNDCHDPHSDRLKAEGSAVCSQCHMPEKFATREHSGHAPGPTAPDCISCHMPARTYMVVDRRHDHSFRIPRPDLSAAFGTPNACNDCHADKTAQWAADAVARWHGPERMGHQTWTEALHRGRAGEPAARALLIDLVSQPAVPGVARATALSELQHFPSAATAITTTAALTDPDPLVRATALRNLAGAPLDARWRLGSPLLADPSLSVRIEAATLLADQPLANLAPDDRKRTEAAFADYEATQRLNADRPEGRANLATFLMRRGQPDAAEKELLAGLKLEPAAAPLSVNLADLYRAEGREADAERVLRQAIALSPEVAAPHFALGLGLVRQKRYPEALAELERATRLQPDDAHYAYVYAVALQSTGQPEAAKAEIGMALARLPYDAELLGFALNNALEARDAALAAPLARTLSAVTPDDPDVARLARQLQQP
ncbi:doubled CXXCH domain-containing protein [Kaistia soli DSM 19436]|uniref:Doubled CXXCH domain-containing protein n=1 Tax=Kaistia soli DSM 19436 TaxID=1122133 RepID=A0A1M5J8Y3_9HYPH|nr:multiheme c-type cytochrome [Kaistia soli]SHG36759.1 doubled CXXCH domain-containing protein [Kaistia soli DSM 19436]